MRILKSSGLIRPLISAQTDRPTSIFEGKLRDRQRERELSKENRIGARGVMDPPPLVPAPEPDLGPSWHMDPLLGLHGSNF